MAGCCITKICAVSLLVKKREKKEACKLKQY